MGRHRHDDDDPVVILDGGAVAGSAAAAPPPSRWVSVFSGSTADAGDFETRAQRRRRLAGLFAAAALGLAVLFAVSSVLTTPAPRDTDRAGGLGPGLPVATPDEVPAPVPASGSPSPTPARSASPSRPVATGPSTTRRPSPTRTTPQPPRTTATSAAPVTITQTTAGPGTGVENLVLGTRRSLRLAATSDRYVTRRDQSYSNLVRVTSQSSQDTRDDATVTVVAGLADDDCFSFRLSGGRYLRHRDYRLRFEHHDGSQLFRLDATFCARPQQGGTVAFESENYPGYFIHVRDDGRIWIDRHPPASEAVFRVTSPLD